MFQTFLKRELATGFKQPMVYIFTAIIALLVFGAVTSDSIVIGGSIGNVKRNAPFVISTFFQIITLISLLIAAAFFNNAALRDHAYQFNEIMFSLPLKKAGYFWGRFVGALILSITPLMGVFIGTALGTLIGPLAGWIQPDQVGEVMLSSLFSNYVVFVLPNMFVAGSIIFLLGHKWRNTIISFVGALAILVIYLITGSLLSDIEHETIGALLDVFGISTFSAQTKYWTPLEKNTLNPSLSGLMLYNRLIWVAFGTLVSILSYWLFSFRIGTSKAKKKEDEATKIPTGVFKRSTPSFEKGLYLRQFISFFQVSFNAIIKSPVFKILFIFGFILLISSLWGGYDYFGLKSYPLTYKILGTVGGSTGIFTIIIMVFFSGELVWKERLANFDEVIHATPHASWVQLAAKASALAVLGTLLVGFYYCIGIGYQLVNGYTRIDLHVYGVNLFLDGLPEFLFYGSLFIFIQTIIKNRYVGYFVSILIVVLWGLLLSALEISSNMLRLNGAPSISYSDISGFGPGWTGFLFFKGYWVLIGILFLLLAGLFYPREKVFGLGNRWNKALINSRGIVGRILIGVLVIWMGLASFIFYNTQVLNSYESSKSREVSSANYEKTYRKYIDLAQLTVTAVRYEIDIFPEERDVSTRSQITLTNKTDVPIDSIHFSYGSGWDYEYDIPNSDLALDDEELGYRIYALAHPIQPGEQMEITIKSEFITEGFENFTGSTSILKNGTFLNNSAILPAMGYQEGAELSDKFTRREYGLKPKKRIPELIEGACSKACNVNYLTNGTAEWVDVETIISTSSDQIAIAPGSLIRSWDEGNRKYFHYKVDHKSQNFYSFMSAKYNIARGKYRDIDIEIYYHPEHDDNIEMMINAVQKSLKYYEEQFGPYYHKQARIIEFPRYATFAQAFPGTMPYSEGFGFISNLEDTTKNNVIDAVIAHEMAHQWWAHQEVSARMQGGTMLTESFSEYSSLMVMKSTSDDMKMKQFLKYDFNRYLRGRSTERIKEVPLYKVENQSYIHYGKGAVIMYALQDYIGQDSVNAALKSFLEEFRYKEPPYPRSVDFLRHLETRVPDSLQYLLDDWFKKITLYDFRLKEATLKKVNDTNYQVSFTIDATKIYADTLGEEVMVPIDDWVDIGVYGEEEDDLISYKRVKLDQQESVHSITVNRKPSKAEIDPRMILIERIRDDNSKSLN